MPDKILVSVVIPTRNRADLVTRAVRSALEQSLREIEVVVVVDGPDPGTLARLAGVRDDRLRVIALPESVGGSGARNTGVAQAQGTWIAFLDDDDEWLADKLLKQLRAATRLGASFPVVASRFIARSPRCEYLWPRRLPEPAEPMSDYLFVRRSFFFGEGLLQTSTLFAPRELLQQVPFSAGLKKHQDWDWVLRAAQQEGVRFEILPEPLAIWYIEEGRKTVSTGSSWRVSFDWIRGSRQLVTGRAYAAFLASEVGAQAARDREWPAFRLLLWEMFRFGSPRCLDLVTYFAMWLMPQDFRRQARAFLTKNRLPLRNRICRI